MNSDLATRLRFALGRESVNSFAQRCGIAESGVRKYLTGSEPGAAKAAAMAKALGVRLDWLVSGEEPMRMDAFDQPAKASLLNRDVLVAAMIAVDEHLSSRGRALPPSEKAVLVESLYEMRMSDLDKEARPSDNAPDGMTERKSSA